MLGKTLLAQVETSSRTIDANIANDSVVDGSYEKHSYNYRSSGGTELNLSGKTQNYNIN